MSGRINVHGMKIRVPPLLIMATLNYWNGPERTNVHGMKRRVPLLLRMVTLKCWNGRGRMAVFGMKKYLKMEEGMETLIWYVIWKNKVVLADCMKRIIQIKNYNNLCCVFPMVFSSLRHPFFRKLLSISRYTYHNDSRLVTIIMLKCIRGTRTIRAKIFFFNVR